MIRIRISHLLILLMVVFLILGMPVAAQDETPTLEVVETETVTQTEAVQDAVVDDVPSPSNAGETVDNHTWWDDFLESPLIYMLGISLVIGVVQINRPQTAAEYQRTKDDIARQREQAEQTTTPYDDWLVEAREVLNELRRRQEPTEANPVPPSQPPSQNHDEVGDRPVVTINRPSEPVIEPPQIVPLWLPINPNWGLNKTGGNGLAYDDREYGGRKVAVPHDFVYIGAPGGVDGSASVHPDTFYKRGDGFEMAISHRAGLFGYSFNIVNFVLAERQRFAVVVQYDAVFKPERNEDGSSPVQIIATLIHGGKKIAELPAQPVVMARESEVQWVFQTDRDYFGMSVVVQILMPYAVVQDSGTFLWKIIKVVPVPDDYADNAVTRI